MAHPTIDQKYYTVLSKNTFYFYNEIFEEKYESHVNSIKETLLVFKNEIENKGLNKAQLEYLISEKENGLKALLALTGFSNESFNRLITVIRLVDNPELTKLVFKDKWSKRENSAGISEWGTSKIQKLINTNEYFRKGIVNIFFEGASIPYLANAIPLFELKKLGISKLNFEIPSMIDTLIRCKEKGSYSGNKNNNPETLIENLLNLLEIPFEKGDLGELIKNAPDTKRKMDFVIPNKKDPRIIVESSFLVTTSSGQGDKSKTEISINSLIKEHYPKAIFIGFVDGIGWYVRKGDLKRMIASYEDVFTFHKDELERFEKLLTKMFKK